MYYIGVDLGGTNISTGLVNEKGEIICKASAKTLGSREPSEIAKDMAQTVLEVIKNGGISEDEVHSVGIGVPGCVDNKQGKVIYTSNMNFSGFNLVPEMQKYINKPVFMANDANCAALGETVNGAAKGHSNVILITIGTGIGGGFVYDTKIYTGFNDAAMEVGHMTINAEGKKCNCGRLGCWERYASANGLIELTEEFMKENENTLMHELAEKTGHVSGRTSFDAARAGDEVAIKVVDKYAFYLGAGLANLINIFQPEMIIVGGGISHEGDFLLDRVREYIKTNTYGYGMIPNTVIEKAVLENDAGIIGAAFIGK
ncbi:MAG: ROK family protein [Clostridia bacterium]|nr:ROK family protein [Clostridia bacterium]